MSSKRSSPYFEACPTDVNRSTPARRSLLLSCSSQNRYRWGSWEMFAWTAPQITLPGKRCAATSLRSSDERSLRSLVWHRHRLRNASDDSKVVPTTSCRISVGWLVWHRAIIQSPCDALVLPATVHERIPQPALPCQSPGLLHGARDRSHAKSSALILFRIAPFPGNRSRLLCPVRC